MDEGLADEDNFVAVGGKVDYWETISGLTRTLPMRASCHIAVNAEIRVNQSHDWSHAR